MREVFFGVGTRVRPRPIGKRARGMNEGQKRRTRSAGKGALVRNEEHTGESRGERGVVEERRRRPIDKQINRGWKDDPQSYRSTWLRLSLLLLSFSPSLSPLGLSFSFSLYLFSQSPHTCIYASCALAGRGVERLFRSRNLSAVRNLLAFRGDL